LKRIFREKEIDSWTENVYNQTVNAYKEYVSEKEEECVRFFFLRDVFLQIKSNAKGD